MDSPAEGAVRLRSDMRGSVRGGQYVLVVPGVLGDGVAGWLPVGWAYVEGPVCGHDEPVADTEAVADPCEGEASSTSIQVLLSGS